jgi:hypothetical protein
MIVSLIFRVLLFPHQGNIVMIDQIVLFTLDLRTNAGSNIPFIDDSKNSYTSVSVGMFKESSLMGTFTLSRPHPSTNISLINMISSLTSGSLGSFDP